jgi:hypothetical protein
MWARLFVCLFAASVVFSPYSCRQYEVEERACYAEQITVHGSEEGERR